jgi:hypothetical protein
MQVQFKAEQLWDVASHSRESVGPGHEAVMERSCEDSAVKL